MLSFFSKPTRTGGFCDGVSRRDFLTVGGSLLGGLSLADILRAEAAGHANTHAHRAVINVFLPGGPPHMDMWDMKPDAPREFRGEFKPIQTNVPGIQICELFPRMAAHDGQVRPRPLAGRLRGRPRLLPVHDRPATHRPGIPASGRCSARGFRKLQGPAHPSMPANLSLMYRTGEARWGNPYHARLPWPAPMIPCRSSTAARQTPARPTWS